MSERQMVPVFTVKVDAADPHFFTVDVDVQGLAASNRYTLAGVMSRLEFEAQSNGVGPYQDIRRVNDWQDS